MTQKNDNPGLGDQYKLAYELIKANNEMMRDLAKDRAKIHEPSPTLDYFVSLYTAPIDGMNESAQKIPIPSDGQK